MPTMPTHDNPSGPASLGALVLDYASRSHKMVRLLVTGGDWRTVQRQLFLIEKAIWGIDPSWSPSRVPSRMDIRSTV